ncbi:hypothetical protein Gohar_015495 [Gossypium harknessii]|uniref:Zinc knuckle CX2CX4HX4C domain-containing protein n=1 Tax=Gossypium harknessii TaxID=34285 RepID=A0A7J9G0G8_9ROSI|nr:hypothetical protein [Gossypium harknessii]
MVVFVDLEKPLTLQVLINGRLQRVKFEALPEICFLCGKYGYLQSLCLSSLTDRNSHGGEENSKSSLSSGTTPVKKRDVLPMTGEAFSPWMVVERKSRRKQERIRGQKVKISKGNLVGSRFEALSSMDTEALTSGKGLEKVNRSMAVDKMGEEMLGHDDDIGSGKKSGPLEVNSVGQALGPKTHVSSGVGGLAPEAGFEHKDPTVSISLSNDKAISLHVNPTLVKHPEINQMSNMAVSEFLISFKRVSSDKVDLVIAKLGFQNSHHVEAVSFSGSIWIGWRDLISVEVLQSYPQFVLAKVTDSSFR